MKKPASNSSKKQQQIKKLESLINASKILNSTLDLGVLLSLILDLATKNLKADRGTIYLIDAARNELWSKVLKGKELVEIRLPIGTGIAGYVAKSGKTVNLKDAWRDKRFFSGFDIRSGFQTKTMLCMTMRDREGKIIGVFQILNKKKGVFDKNDERFLGAFSVHAALAIENAKLHQAIVEKERIEKEIEIAGSIQRRLLPKEIPLIPGYEVDATARPCKTVGGDYYDIIELGGGNYALVVADVSGKGIPAALLVSTLHAALHAYIETNIDLVDLVGKLNQVVFNNTEPERYITFVVALLDTNAGTMTYVNAGHNFPFVIKSDTKEVSLLGKGGLPLGMFDGVTFQKETVSLGKNDNVVMYTDGVTEAMNTSEKEYSEDRFKRCIVEHSHRPVNDLKGHIISDVEQFTEGQSQSDDLTLLLLKRLR